MAKMSMIYDALLDLHAEMILDQALAEFKKKQIYEAIDQALVRGDEAGFLKWTQELKALRERPSF